MMAQRCRLDRHHCVPAVVVAKVDQRPVDLSSRNGTQSSDHRMVVVRPACAPNMTVCPSSRAWRTEYRFLWLSGMTRAADGSTRWINLPSCARTTQSKSPLCVALLVFPLNPETALWSSDMLLVNKRYCSMCTYVPESTRAKCELGDSCTFVCSTIRQVWRCCVMLMIRHQSRVVSRHRTTCGRPDYGLK